MSNEDRFVALERRMGGLEDDMRKFRDSDMERAIDMATLTTKLDTLIKTLEGGWSKRMQYAVLVIALASLILGIYDRLSKVVP